MFDPLITSDDLVNELKTRTVGLSELLTTSDIISLHTPLSKNTINIIDTAEISLMKASCILINAARGGIVNELVLAEAIIHSKIGGAVIDVYATEPPSHDNPVFMVPKPQINKLLLTPHIAGITSQAWSRLFSKSWENVVDFVFNKNASFVVN